MDSTNAYNRRHQQPQITFARHPEIGIGEPGYRTVAYQGSTYIVPREFGEPEKRVP